MKQQHFITAALLFLGIMAGTHQVIGGEEIVPPLASPAVIQTTGPQGQLSHGDWWSSSEPQAGNQPHRFDLYVPCTVPDDFIIQLELYDPECYATGDEADEMRGSGWDQTTFRLLAPDGTTVLINRTYSPGLSTSGVWSAFATLAAGAYGCGIYQILVTTAVDDENTYRLKIVENDPDGVPDSGDELHLAIAKSSLQMQSAGTATLQFYVPPQTPELLLANFGMDSAGSVWYTSPAGDSIGGTVSGDLTWNNSTSTALPPPGGDVITAPEPGLWSISLQTNLRNQFSLYSPSSFFSGGPVTVDPPELRLTLQDGLDRVNKRQLVTYVANLANQGSGTAHDCSLQVALSPGLSIVDAGAGIALTPQLWLWTTPLLAPGADSTLSFVVLVSGAATNPVVGTAQASGADAIFQRYTTPQVLDIDQLQVSGSISGRLWQDRNNDRLFQAPESPLANIRIDLYDRLGSIILADTTDSQGLYTFPQLSIGEYQVQPDPAALPLDWYPTTMVHEQWYTITDLGESYEGINLGYNAELTPVEFSALTALGRSGAIELKWTTQSESENLGFHIYRSQSSEGEYIRVSRTMVPGAGSSSTARHYSWTDQLPGASGRYYYKVADISSSGAESFHGPVSAAVLEMPAAYELGQNYPNPFNSSTMIPLTLMESGRARLVIHNLLGQAVRVLVDAEYEAGEHRVVWDGFNDAGMSMPAGIYLYTLQVNGHHMTRKMHYIR